MRNVLKTYILLLVNVCQVAWHLFVLLVSFFVILLVVFGAIVIVLLVVLFAIIGAVFDAIIPVFLILLIVFSINFADSGSVLIIVFCVVFIIVIVIILIFVF